MNPGRKSFLAASGAIGIAALLPKATLAAPPAMPAMQPLPAADMQADADMRRVIDALAAFNAPPIQRTTPPVARELPSFADALRTVLSNDGKPTVEPVGKIVNMMIPAPTPDSMLVRIYTPMSGSAPYPVIVYFHGGGWVIADLDTYDATPRSLANQVGAIVVSVAYRKAPEHPFPAAVQDAFVAYRWVTANAASIGGDPRRIAIAGESAGGNLATVTALHARMRGVTMPKHQLLVYPVTTFVGTPPPSYAQNPMTIPLSTPALKWFGRYYLRSMADGRSPMASPMLANVAGLPPATIINADIDPLRDDGAAYATKLQSAGVAVTHTVYPGVTHEFFGMGAAVGKAAQAMAQAANALKAALT